MVTHLILLTPTGLSWTPILCPPCGFPVRAFAYTRLGLNHAAYWNFFVLLGSSGMNHFKKASLVSQLSFAHEHPQLNAAMPSVVCAFCWRATWTTSGLALCCLCLSTPFWVQCSAVTFFFMVLCSSYKKILFTLLTGDCVSNLEPTT